MTKALRSASLPALICTPVFLAGVAHADTGGLFPPNNVGVLDRPRPDYEAQGIQVGGFDFYPKIAADAAYDDNIFGETNAEGDFVWSVSPSLDISSDWGRNSLSFSGSLTRQEYLDHPILNDTSWNLELAGVLNVTSSATLKASAAYSQDVEAKTSPNNIPGTTGQVTYNLAEGHVVGAYQSSRWLATVGVDAYQYRFDPDQTAQGSLIDEAQRNHEEYKISGRFEYAFSPMTAVFIQASGGERRYDQQPPVTDINRDSSGGGALVGLHFQLSHLIDGQVGVGYLHWDYVDPAAKPFSGIDALAKINWYATPLVTVSFNAARSVDDSGLPDVAGYVDNEVASRVDYELLRNLIISGQIQYDGLDYVDIDRTDHRTSASLRASYLINHDLGLGLTYAHINQDSLGAAKGIDFGDNRITLELILQR